MSDIQQFVSLISNILQSNNSQIRKQSEITLIHLRQNSPNELMIAFLLILQNKGKIQHKNFAATQLRLCLSSFSPITYKNLWSKLTIQNQEQIKLKLFQIIYKQEDQSIKRHLCDTLGQIAGSIISTDNKAWSNFRTNIWTLFQDNNIESNLSAFNILQSFFSYAPSHFKDDYNNLYTLFKAGLTNENMKIRAAALKSFASYLQIIETKKQKDFEELIIPIYQTVYYLLVKDKGNQIGLQTLAEMIEGQQKFFKKKFKQMYELMRKIFEIKSLDSRIKRMATQIMIDYAEKYPALYRKKNDILTGVIQMVFAHMIQIDNQISYQWKNPSEGYNNDMEGDQDFQTTRFGMCAVDRLISAIGQQQLLPVLSNIIQQMLGSNDWRYKYTAVMALSQIGQYIDQADKISSIMQLIANFLKDQNPMLRYAACHAIGQISDDMRPKFQEKYGDPLLPEVIKLLKDPIPRVVSHAAAALTNFLQGMRYNAVQKYMDQMMECLLYHSMNGISLVKESALSTISSVAELCIKRFNKYFEKTLQVLFEIFPSHRRKQYKQLKGQAVQTLTIIATCVGPETFKPFAQKLIDLMIQIQNSQFQQVDPQKTYILAGWQRLCLIYGKSLAGKLDQILPSLFTLVENVIKIELQISLSPDQKKESIQQGKNKQSINTYETQEAQITISMLNVFIERLKQLYAPYVEKTVQLLCKIIKEHPNEDVKQQACKCLPNLIACVKETSNYQVAVNLGKYFMKVLISLSQKQIEAQIMITYLSTLKKIIDQISLAFLTNDEVTVFSQKIMNLLKSCDQKKVNNREYLNQEDVDEQEKQLVGQENKQEEEVQVAVSELIGSLFKTHGDATMPLANYLIKAVFPQVFKNGQSENMYKFGIFLINDMVQFLGFNRLKDQWFHFGQVLINFSQQNSCINRQAACYGLGVFAQKTPTQVLKSQLVFTWLNKLVSSTKIPKGQQKQKTYGYCRDNIIASVGKIIRSHGQAFDMKHYTDIWFSFLPLKYDKSQGCTQHEFLVDMMLHKPDLILGGAQPEISTKMIRVLSLYAEFNSFSQIANKRIQQKMKQHLISLQHNQGFKSSLMNIWNTLNDKQRKQLNKIVNPSQ